MNKFLLAAWLCVWIGGCTTTGERQEWQNCSGVFHEDCWEGNDDWSRSQMCEYAYYKDCIGETEEKTVRVFERWDPKREILPE